MKKQKLLTVLLIGGTLLVFPFTLHAQMITRVAVVDIPKIYTAFFKDSAAVREFEERSARVQAEINKMTEEIQALQKSKLEAEAAKNSSRALQLDNEIYKKTEYLKEFYRIKTAELEDQRKKLAQSSSFLQQVYNEIKIVAESEGYSVVFNIKDTAGIIWYSPSVDITDKVLQNLLTKAGKQ
ncbi:MAG: OmpH family outer membrane protein [Treponemataceae bacterium]|nr:OmpH family outer membrane protein [Treponemataceae bacterium]